MEKFKHLSTVALLLVLAASCAQQDSVPFNDAAFGGVSSLYVASGSCYGGGVTVSTGPSNTVTKFNIKSGMLEQVVIDYNQVAPGDSPVSIAPYDQDHILVLVENAGGRRIDLVNKDGSGYRTYLTNATALSAALRSITILSDFSLLVSKSTAIEKFNPSKARVTSGANPWVNAPAGSCATSTTLISSAIVDPTGKIIYTHAAATPNNKIGVIKSTGYAAAADCLSGTAAPSTTALPTRAIFHPTGKLFVSYGSTTAASNFVYSYDYNSSTGAISNPIAAWSDGGSIVNGPSSLAIDPNTGNVFVANATSTFNTIEQFTYDGIFLNRVNGPTFIPSNIYTRCVSDMKAMP